jgi:hypothetical protein
MTKNILEWGWHTSSPNSSSSSDSEWEPATTLLGGAEPHAPVSEPDQKVPAWGDKGCQRCASDGKRGTTGMYEIMGRIMCAPCAEKEKKVQGLPADEKIRILTPYLLEP